MMLAEYCPEIEVLGTAGNVTEGRQKITDLQPDLVFVDIRMPSGTEGIELIESFENRLFDVVLVTAFRHYAESALEKFGLEPAQLVLKPIDTEELLNAVAAVRRRIAGS